MILPEQLSQALVDIDQLNKALGNIDQLTETIGALTRILDRQADQMIVDRFLLEQEAKRQQNKPHVFRPPSDGGGAA